MTKDKYLRYGLAIVAGGAVAVWAGVPLSLLLFLLVCPLMMFVMMRVMHGEQVNDGGHSSQDATASASSNVKQPSRASRPRPLDGSHESID